MSNNLNIKVNLHMEKLIAKLNTIWKVTTKLYFRGLHTQPLICLK